HDADGSAASRRLVADLGAGGAFRARSYDTRAALEAALVGGEIGVAVMIPPDFDRRLREAPHGGRRPEVQVLYDGAETVLAGNSEAFLTGIVTASGAAISQRALGAAPAHEITPGLAVVTHALFNPRLEGTPFMVAGVFGFVLSFLTVLITAVSIVNERLGGTFEQLQLTPATNLEILLGKLLPLGAVFALDVVIMMLTAGFALGVWPVGNVVLFVGISSFYILTSLALGLILSATSATAAEAVQKTVLTSIPLVQLSGFAFPIRNMPEPVQWIAEVFPATHYIRVSRAIYLRGEGFVELLPEIGALLLFGGILVAFALRSLGRRA
ncbi:MAG: ABC transporter permease, partial [Deltaproteobacteria bacterium]|nr:ABC transporter permease [Deltaproteobacteria bacterium]